jgi:hypothetical protein
MAYLEQLGPRRLLGSRPADAQTAVKSLSFIEQESLRFTACERSEPLRQSFHCHHNYRRPKPALLQSIPLSNSSVTVSCELLRAFVDIFFSPYCLAPC